MHATFVSTSQKKNIIIHVFFFHLRAAFTPNHFLRKRRGQNRCPRHGEKEHLTTPLKTTYSWRELPQSEGHARKNVTFGGNVVSREPAFVPLVRLQALYENKSWCFVRKKKKYSNDKEKRNRKGNA